MNRMVIEFNLCVMVRAKDQDAAVRLLPPLKENPSISNISPKHRGKKKGIFYRLKIGAPDIPEKCWELSGRDWGD